MDKGYTVKQQPTEGEPVPHIGGIALSSNPEEFLEADPFDAKESPENNKSNGTLPNFTLPEFANGTDNRNRG
jgi:hypothetical protein